MSAEPPRHCPGRAAGELDGITPEGEVGALAAALAKGALLPEEEEHMIWLSCLAAGPVAASPG
ncbi:MAG TPA: hypothetical protein VGS07_03150 [Thermoanaerobaculia bacterium]|nr:hypothetical protein [Thermoanaerobaculia bacterium]